MRFLVTLLVHTVVVVLFAVALEATGAPVAEFITWGAAQVAAVIAQVEWPAWVDAGRVEQVTAPVQAVVNTAAEWVAQLGRAE